MTDSILASIDREIAETERKLEQLRRTRATYLGETPEAKPVRDTRFRYTGRIPFDAISEYLREHGPTKQIALMKAMMDGGLTYNNQKPEWSVRRAIQLNAGLTKLTVNGKVVDMRKHKK
jgi:hypothetical protein